MVFEVLLVLVLIFFSGVLSCGETSLTAASRARLYKKAADGRKNAQRAMNVMERKDKIISVLLLSNNALNILATSVATVAFVKLMGDGNGVVFSTISMTILLFLLGEFVPKVFALHKADTVILYLSPLMQLLSKLLYPMIKIMEEAVVNSILRLLSINVKAPLPTRDQDDLKNSIELHEKDGFLVKEDKNMLASIFDLEKVQVEEVMIHRKSMHAVGVHWTKEEILDHIKEHGHSYFPVWRDDPQNIVGFLESKSLINHKENTIDLPSMIRKPQFIPASRTLSKQLAYFKRGEIPHIRLVVDEYGSILGMITLQDIMEEIVGRLPLDSEKQRIIRDRKKGWLVDGDTTLRDVRRITDLNISSKNANTIAGFIMDKLGSIPEAGQHFVFNSIKFQILEKKKNQITRIRIAESASPPASSKT